MNRRYIVYVELTLRGPDGTVTKQPANHIFTVHPGSLLDHPSDWQAGMAFWNWLTGQWLKGNLVTYLVPLGHEVIDLKTTRLELLDPLPAGHGDPDAS